MLLLFKKKKSNTKPVSKDEIGKVIRELVPTKALGPNCFKVAFPEIVKEQVTPLSVNYLKAFKKDGKLLSLYRGKLTFLKIRFSHVEQPH